MKPCLVYVRFSPRPKKKHGVEAKDPDSILVQLDRIEAYNQLAGLVTAEVFEDPHTSAGIPLAHRPNGAELVRRAEKTRMPIVCQKLDRIFRDAVDGLATLRRWDKIGVKLHLASQAGVSVDTSTATGKLVIAMLLNVAEFEKDLTAERTRDAMRRKVRNGERVGAEAPWGHMLDPGDESRVIPNVYEQGILDGMLELRSDNYSTRMIASILNDKNLCPRGRKWTHSSVARALKAWSGARR